MRFSYLIMSLAAMTCFAWVVGGQEEQLLQSVARDDSPLAQKMSDEKSLSTRCAKSALWCANHICCGQPCHCICTKCCAYIHRFCEGEDAYDPHLSPKSQS
jgi:hypothetical protein